MFIIFLSEIIMTLYKFSNAPHRKWNMLFVLCRIYRYGRHYGSYRHYKPDGCIPEQNIKSGHNLKSILFLIQIKTPEQNLPSFRNQSSVYKKVKHKINLRKAKKYNIKKKKKRSQTRKLQNDFFFLFPSSSYDKRASISRLPGSIANRLLAVEYFVLLFFLSSGLGLFFLFNVFLATEYFFSSLTRLSQHW